MGKGGDLGKTALEWGSAVALAPFTGGLSLVYQGGKTVDKMGSMFDVDETNTPAPNVTQQDYNPLRGQETTSADVETAKKKVIRPSQPSLLKSVGEKQLTNQTRLLGNG